VTRATYLSGAETFSERAVVLQVRPGQVAPVARAKPARHPKVPSLAALKRQLAARSAAGLNDAEANGKRMIGRARL